MMKWVIRLGQFYKIYALHSPFDHQNEMILLYKLKTSENISQKGVINVDNKNIIGMKVIALLAVLCVLSLQQTVLLSSSTSNTIITSPANTPIGVDSFHNTNNLNYIGFDAQWLWKNGSSSWPNGDTVTFQAQFYADCGNSATLYITADNSFTASLNNGPAMTGNTWTANYTFQLSNIQCGLNTLIITAVNLNGGSPAAVIFAVVQNQVGCYSCRTPLAFYNRDTCKCECLQKCDCIKPLTWADYPTCGCLCKQAKICPPKQYWNDATCSCQCIRIACLPGYFQDPKSCQCRCVNNVACPKGKVWNADQCKCVCQFPVSCIPPFFWNEDTCSCQIKLPPIDINIPLL